MKYLLIVFLFLVGCVKAGTVVEQHEAKEDFEVKLLFESGGCKVYRFYDNGRHRYFTNCSETISAYSESCGKNCTRTMDENIKGVK